MSDQVHTLNLTPMENPPLMVLVIKSPEGEDKPLVTIRANGTVQIHEPGSEPVAAKIFYGALQIEGQTLYGKIKDLELLNANLREINKDQARRIITLTTDNYRLTERASL